VVLIFFSATAKKVRELKTMSIIPLQDLVMIQKNLKRKIETVFVAKNLFRFRELNKTKMNKRFCSVCLYDE
jgi:hypothetical protein